MRKIPRYCCSRCGWELPTPLSDSPGWTCDRIGPDGQLCGGLPTNCVAPVAQKRAKKGRCFLCIAPNAWGKGPTPASARRKAREHFSPSLSGRWRWVLYDAPADAWVDQIGAVCWKEPGNTMVEVARSRLARKRVEP
jgi:hypothetical protein